MPNYKKMYFQLAAKVADAIDILAEAQQRGEDEYSLGNMKAIALIDENSGRDENEMV